MRITFFTMRKTFGNVGEACRPYDCAIWRVQVKREEITWHLGFATWKEPGGRLEGCEPQVPCAPVAPGLHNQSEGAYDQQH